MKKASRYLILVLSVMLLTTSVAGAFDGPRAYSDHSASPNASTPESSARTPVAGQPRSVSYKLYEGAIDAEASVATRPRTVSAKPPNTALPSPPSPPQPPASTAPMTAGEKFGLFARKSFLSPSPYAISILSGLLGETTDKDHGRHMTTGDFLADAGTHAARGFTFRATANFFEKFAFATALRQDPRYHRSDKKGAGAKLVYAVTRVFVTQGDRCGCNQFNASFLGGGLAASGMSQLWIREEDKSLSKVFTSWGSHIAVRAFLNVLSEFVGGQ